MSETDDQRKSEPTGSDLTIGSGNEGSSISPDSIEGIFLLALQKEDPVERNAWLDEVCADDESKRLRVNALLAAYDDAGSFLETPAHGQVRCEEISLSFLKPSDKDGCLGMIGPYDVLEVIGRGGMGIVLRAIDPKLNRIVAVKVLLPELAANPNARRRFLREAQAAAAISHPHVVTIHAVEEAVDREESAPPYLVMECVVGQSLQEKLDAIGPLRLAEIVRISRQISDGLAAAHRQGVIHRDIKPANILLENGVERVKITDFGLARAVDDITVTRTGEVTGTPQYMSPEQANGERVDHRSDLFSLGCVMYAMCTGHSPFRGDSIAHVIKRVTQDTPRPISEQNSESPRWLVEIITCLLQKNADQRIQTAEGLVAILDQHLAVIQQPSGSQRHSVVNQRLPLTASRNRSTDAAALQEATVARGEAAQTSAIGAKWMRWVVRASLLCASLLLLGIGYGRLALGVYPGPQELLLVVVTWSLLALLLVRDVQSPSATESLASLLTRIPNPFAWLFPAQDSEQSIHARVGRFAIPAVVVVAFGLLVSQWNSVAVVENTERDLSGNSTAFPVAQPPVLTLKHPEWGEIRELMVNRLGSSRGQRSSTETDVFLKPEHLGERIDIYVILKDGREWSRYAWPVESLRDEIRISEDDLALNHRALVEVVEDAPGVKLRQIEYPTQPISVNTFYISDAPFHKALAPGEHRIVLDYVLEDWDVPEGFVQFNKLDYRLTVPDATPFKVSLKAILDEHAQDAKTHKMRWKPDFKPLKKPEETAVTQHTFDPEIDVATYRVGPGDLLGIHVNEVTTQSHQPPPMKLRSRYSVGQMAVGMPFLVMDNGRIELPYQISLEVSDLTLSEIAERIRSFCEDEHNILKKGQSGVVVTVLEPRTAESSEWLIDYRIQPGDTLAICIDDLRRKKDEPHISVMPPIVFPRDRAICAAIGTPYIVDKDGAVQLPLVGTVSVKGLSLSEARTTILKAYTGENPIFRASKMGYVAVTFFSRKSARGSETR